MFRLKVCYKSGSGMGGGGSGGARGRGPIRSTGLPTIQGSERQRAWAEDIRSRAIRDYNDYEFAANQVLSGNGDRGPNSLAEARSISNENFAASYRGVVAKMSRRMMRYTSGTPQGKNEAERVRKALSDMRKNIMSQTDARYWIDRR